MTDWRKVTGSQSERPQEFDTDSSPTTVYQHRNIEQITVENGETTTTLWQYDEREMTPEEYKTLSMELAIARNRADIDYIAMSADIELEED